MNYLEIITLQTKLLKKTENFSSTNNCSIFNFTLRNGLQCCIRFISSGEENNFIANLDLHFPEGVSSKFESIDNVQNLLDIIETLETETYSPQKDPAAKSVQKQTNMQAPKTSEETDSGAEEYLDQMEEINNDGTKFVKKLRPQKQPQKNTPVQPDLMKRVPWEYDFEYDNDVEVKKAPKKFRKRKFNRRTKNIKHTIFIGIAVIVVVFALFLCFAGIQSCMTKKESVTRNFSTSIDTSLGTIYLTPGKTYQLIDGNYEFSDPDVFDKAGESGMIIQNANVGDQIQLTVSDSINGTYDGNYMIEFVSYPIDTFIFPQDLQQ